MKETTTSAAGAATAKVRTDLYVADISSQGGDITRLELVRHPDTEDKSKHFVLFDNGAKLLKATERHGLEGIVSKRQASAYRSGPSPIG